MWDITVSAAVQTIPSGFTWSSTRMADNDVRWKDKPRQQSLSVTEKKRQNVYQYDADVVSLEFLLRMFFKAIDPTSLNKQGPDEGTRYRTGVYYTDPEDLPVIEKVLAESRRTYSYAEAQPVLARFCVQRY